MPIAPIESMIKPVPAEHRVTKVTPRWKPSILKYSHRQYQAQSRQDAPEIIENEEKRCWVCLQAQDASHNRTNVTTSLYQTIGGLVNPVFSLNPKKSRNKVKKDPKTQNQALAAHIQSLSSTRRNGVRPRTARPTAQITEAMPQNAQGKHPHPPGPPLLLLPDENPEFLSIFGRLEITVENRQHEQVQPRLQRRPGYVRSIRIKNKAWRKFAGLNLESSRQEGHFSRLSHHWACLLGAPPEAGFPSPALRGIAT